jgi:hypothetical protein
MAVDTNVWNATQFATKTITAFQNEGGRLKGMVTAANEIKNAEKAVFFRDGKVRAREFRRGDDVIVQNGDRIRFERNLKSYDVTQACDDFDLDRITVDENDALNKAGTMALKRQYDIELYREMMAVRTTFTPGLDFGINPFTLDRALLACSVLQQQIKVWDGNVFCGLPPLQFNQLISFRQLASRDWVKDDQMPFSKATTMVFWNGVYWFLNVEEDPMDFYRVPGANTQDIFMWHKSALGWGNHTELKVERDRDWAKKRAIIQMEMKGLAVALHEGNGIICMRTSSNSAITVN